jgi:hypothetical protein
MSAKDRKNRHRERVVDGGKYLGGGGAGAGEHDALGLPWARDRVRRGKECGTLSAEEAFR